ncbi:hypothetical protein, partial [Rhizorhabdus sp.]|uniref:hypothetical protein n=1 Tax=Rhizorhabdus sp. TaxID=1968843 RepID=UPI0035AE35D8
VNTVTCVMAVLKRVLMCDLKDVLRTPLRFGKRVRPDGYCGRYGRRAVAKGRKCWVVSLDEFRTSVQLRCKVRKITTCSLLVLGFKAAKA